MVYSPLTTHYSLCKKAAFTLAETLITLGIIGVVAAMTIPNLVQSYKKQEYSVRLKRFYSTMQNAIKMSEIEHGPAQDWTYPTEETADAVETWWNTYFAHYFKNVIKTEKTGVYFYVYFTDGSYVRIEKQSALDIKYDVNGLKGKNSIGYDMFAFLFRCTNDGGGKKGTFTTYDWTDDINNGNFGTKDFEYSDEMKDRDNVLKLCKGVATNFCSQLLLLDGWEFKDDYPYKL